MSDHAPELRSTLAVLRRQRRLLAMAGLIGLLLAGVYTAIRPPRYASTALMLLAVPTTPSQNTTGLATTQVEIAGSARVLQAAGAAMHLTLDQVRGRVAVDAPTDQLVSIQAFGDRADDAQRLCAAVANAYVGAVKEAERSVTAASLTDLRSRQSVLETQLTGLQQEITATTARQHAEIPTSADGRRDAQLLAQLQAEQADLWLRVDKVKGDIATSAVQGSLTDPGVSVVQPAAAATRPSLLGTLAIRLLIGLLAGVLIAAAALLIQARQDRRIRRRDDIADAVGATVLASVRSRPQGSVAAWVALLSTYDPAPVDAWALRQAIRAMAVTPPRTAAQRAEDRAAGRTWPPSITVVALDGDESGLALGAQLASFAASLGTPTRLVGGAAGLGPAALWAACAPDTAQLRPGLRPARAVPDAAESGGGTAELTVVLSAVDPRTPSLTAVPPTAVTLLAISPGIATREQLARLAVAADDADRRIDGVLIADPDPDDRTTGRQTLPERSGRAALPLRLTGGVAGRFGVEQGSAR